MHTRNYLDSLREFRVGLGVFGKFAREDRASMTTLPVYRLQPSCTELRSYGLLYLLPVRSNISCAPKHPNRLRLGPVRWLAAACASWRLAASLRSHEHDEVWLEIYSTVLVCGVEATEQSLRSPTEAQRSKVQWSWQVSWLRRSHQESVVAAVGS